MEILSILLHYFARTWFVSENFLSLHLLLSVNRIIHSKVNPKGTLQLIYKYTITTIRYYDSHHNKKKKDYSAIRLTIGLQSLSKRRNALIPRLCWALPSIYYGVKCIHTAGLRGAFLFCSNDLVLYMMFLFYPVNFMSLLLCVTIVNH